MPLLTAAPRNWQPTLCDTTQPTITVLIYCPDSSMALQATLDSLLAQSYREMEVLLIHKTNFMGSPSIYEKLSELDLNGVVRMLEVGDSAEVDEALNLGFSVSSGELILPLISGAEIVSSTLDCCLQRFRVHSGVDIVYTNEQTCASSPPENQADGCSFHPRASPIAIPYPAMIRRSSQSLHIPIRPPAPNEKTTPPSSDLFFRSNIYIYIYIYIYI